MDFREAARWLRGRDNYLILTHKRPDGDTIASGAALCELLRTLGKTAWLLDSLDAAANLRLYLEGRVAPAGYAPDTVVSVDVATADLLPDNAAPYLSRIDLAIDHHASHQPFAAECLVEGGMAACGEVVWLLCRELEVMDAEIASLLYVAVATDCGCFVYSNTTPHTHRVAAHLMEQGIPFGLLNKRHFRSKSMARLRLEAMIIEGTELHFQGQMGGQSMAVAAISLEMMAKAGATEDDTEDIASLPGQIQGSAGSVTIRELKPGECKVSLRTHANLLNATETCARLGGGGHPAAAGCTIYGTVTEAKAAILDAIAAQLAGQ